MWHALHTGLLAAIVASGVQAASLNACYERWEPYAYQSGSKHGGAAIETVNLVMSRLGHTVRYQEVPFNRCVYLLSNAKVEMGLFITEEPGHPFVYSQVPLAFWLLAAVVHRDSKITHFEGLQTFKGARVATVRGYRYTLPELEQMQQDEATDAVSSLRKLDAKRVDVMFEDYLWSTMTANRRALNVRALLPLVKVSPEVTGFHDEQLELRNAFDSVLRELIKSGEVDAIYRRHFDHSYREISTMR
ncbi:substrate-binding periplasmic protein [Parachitinimonas caeni]|uniref:Transporter substrate-binding domain-containing protein n=1 Tax=Parachitinimonas caeni TaxID=3031301 RepID=A0ABT7DSL5_9NEIS|nr:transporter substrate-binding domain-containing protein [Parachitinimonas caeni]MDK2122769.1 transporter substrate-binding domain-containing protein [Parachitinimonas caeni]